MLPPSDKEVTPDSETVDQSADLGGQVVGGKTTRSNMARAATASLDPEDPAERDADADASVYDTEVTEIDPQASTMMQVVMPGQDMVELLSTEAETVEGPITSRRYRPGSGTNYETRFSSVHELVNERVNRGRYAVEREEGRGGMGVVLRCTDRDLRRIVAMKVLRKDKRVSNRRLLRFLQEAQVTGQLEHPNIVPIHELGVDEDGRPFFTMKLVDGFSLREVLAGIKGGDLQLEKRFPIHVLLEHFLKVCDGIAFAHSRGVIHRDLKPANIMLGNYGEVLVMDWGLARLLKDEQHESEDSDDKTESVTEDSDVNLTMDGEATGTPSYMPPEQALGDLNALDARSDIFALGAILYEILVKRPPITKRGHATVLERARAGVRDPIPTAVAAELRAIINKAMEPSQDDRYQSVGALADDIRRYLAGFAVSAKRDSLVESFIKLVKRHRSLSVAIIISLVLLVSAGSWFGIRLQQEHVEKALIEHQRQKADAEREKLARERIKPWLPAWQYDAAEDWEPVLQPAGDGQQAMLACGPWLLATGMKTSYGVARRPEQVVQRLDDGLRLFGPTRFAGLRSTILACADSMPGVLANRSMRGNQQFDAEIVLGDERSRAGVFIAGLPLRISSVHQNMRIDLSSSYTQGYAVIISPKELLLRRAWFDVWRMPMTDDVQPGQALQLSLRREFDRITVTLNGEDRITWVDPLPFVGADRSICGVLSEAGFVDVHGAAVSKQGFAKASRPIDFGHYNFERGEMVAAREIFHKAAESPGSFDDRAGLFYAIGQTYLQTSQWNLASESFAAVCAGESDGGRFARMPFAVDGELAAQAARGWLIAELGSQTPTTDDPAAWDGALGQAWARLQALDEVSRTKQLDIILRFLVFTVGYEVLADLDRARALDNIARRLLSSVASDALTKELRLGMAKAWVNGSRKYRGRQAVDERECLDRGKRWAPDELEIAIPCLRMLSVDKRYEDIQRELQRLLALHPRSVAVHIELAKVLQKLGKDSPASIEQAEAKLSLAQDIDPESASIWAAAAELAADTKRWQKAKALFQKVIAVEGAHPVFIEKLAKVHMQLGQYKPALNVLDEVLAMQEQAHQLHALRGRVLLWLKRWGEASAAYESALQYAPDARSRQRYYQSWGNLIPPPGQVKAGNDRPAYEAMRRRFKALRPN